MLTFKNTGLLSLLDDKTLTASQRRRIVATAAALDLIAVAVAQQAATHKLGEEMKQFASYVDAIEAALPSGR